MRKSTMLPLLIGLIVGMGLLSLRDYYLDYAVSDVETAAAVQSLNNNVSVTQADAIRKLKYAGLDLIAALGLMFILGGVAVALFRHLRNLKLSMRSKSAQGLLAVAILGGLLIAGCRPYDTPELVEIKSNDTAFLIPLEGDTAGQDCFKSVEFLQKKQVAERRIQIPHRWLQTGRGTITGSWIPTARVITVDRTPVTRVWDSTDPKVRNAVELSAESRDSLGVTAGFTLTALIAPEDAAVFLFKYKSGTLANVVDTQIKNSIQAVFASECAKYPLVELPLHKQDITDAIKKQVIPFYKDWGITIAADMGFVGGLTYDAKVQEAFDAVFKAQKEKERAEAEKASQVARNERELGIANNEAAMKKIRADAEAYEIQKKADAIKAAGNIYVQTEMAKAFNAMAAKWDGKAPQIMGGNMGMMNMIPLNDIEKK